MSRVRIVLADPPWSYSDKLRMDPLVARSSEDQYKVMSTAEIAAMGSAGRIAEIEIRARRDPLSVGHEQFPA